MADYYSALGLKREELNKRPHGDVNTPGTWENMLRSAHRKKVLETHPDHNQGSKKAETQFIAAQEAYEVLSDPVRRAAYDSRFETNGTQQTTVNNASQDTWAGRYGQKIIHPYRQNISYRQGWDIVWETLKPKTFSGKLYVALMVFGIFNGPSILGNLMGTHPQSVTGSAGQAVPANKPLIIKNNVDSDIEHEGDIIIIGARISGNIKSLKGRVNISNASIDGRVTADGDITINGSRINYDISSTNGRVNIFNNASIDAKVTAHGDVIISGSRINYEVSSTNGRINIFNNAFIDSSITAYGDITVNGSKINYKVRSTNGSVNISNDASIDDDIMAPNGIVNNTDGTSTISGSVVTRRQSQGFGR